MNKIMFRERFKLVGKIIYMENHDCSYWLLTDYDCGHSWYNAIKLDPETCEKTEETSVFTPGDLVGEYVY